MSRRLTALETATGLVLVARRRSPTRLTAQGEAFVPVARRLLAEIQAAREAARKIADTIAANRLA